MVHPRLAGVDAEGHIRLGVANNVLRNTGRTFGCLEQVGDELPYRVEDVAVIKTEVGLQPPEPLTDRLASFTVFVLGVAVYEVTILIGIPHKLINQPRTFRMNRDKPIARRCLVIHAHEANLGVRIDADVVCPKL